MAANMYACKCVASKQRVHDPNGIYDTSPPHQVFRLAGGEVNPEDLPFLCSDEELTLAVINSPNANLAIVRAIKALVDISGLSRMEVHSLVGCSTGKFAINDVPISEKSWQFNSDMAWQHIATGKAAAVVRFTSPNNILLGQANAGHYATVYTNNSDDVYQGMFVEILYKGFSPKELLELLAAIEANAQKFASDMQKLCFLVISRGTKMSKIINALPAKSKLEYSNLRNKYSIADSDRNSLTTPTLPRIAVIFAHYISQLLHKYAEKITLGITSHLPDSYPKGLQFPAAGVLMRGHPALRKLHVYFQYKFTTMLAGGGKPDMQKILQQSRTNMSATHVDDASVLALLQAQGIVDNTGAVTQAVSDLADGVWPELGYPAGISP